MVPWLTAWTAKVDRRWGVRTAFAWAVIAGAFPGDCRSAAVEIVIRAVPDQMRYDRDEFRVAPGDRVRLVFHNDDFMPHNLVLCLPRAFVTPAAEEDNGMEVARAAWSLGAEAGSLQWVPAHPRVMAATRLLGAEMSDVIEFTAPARPGRYPYVCTFPGHATSMFGAMWVQAAVEPLRELEYRVYRGPFRSLPDPGTIAASPVREGRLPDGLIDASIGAPEENFVVEFTGELRVPFAGTYTFTVAGDNGPVLVIDGRVVLDHRRGTSWESSGTATVHLGEGAHRLALHYWHRRDRRKLQPEVTLLWSGEGHAEIALSRVDLIARRQKRDAERDRGMPLVPSDGEPVFYRNYLAGVLPSGFGVGYPGGVNLTWDPVRMNVGSVWAGAFLDVKRHRTLRGGTIAPLGYGVSDPAPGHPLAFLPDPDAPWPDADTARGVYRFLGYSFDARRQPTFRYRFHDIVVSDFFEPRGAALARRLVLRHEGGACGRAYVPGAAWHDGREIHETTSRYRSATSGRGRAVCRRGRLEGNDHWHGRAA